MPRNGSGTYSLPQPSFVPGTTISSAAVNSDFSDIASAITTSIASDGQTPITGPLKQSNGTQATPTWTFNSDTTAGMFLYATGTLGLTAGQFGLLLGSTASKVSVVAIASGGTNYSVGDSITLTGGTALRQAVLTVSTVSGSAITGVTVSDAGLYVVQPTNPVAQGSSTGPGTGATFNITTWLTDDFVCDIDNGVINPLWEDFGASAYMASVMTTVTSAASLYSSLLGTTLSPASIGSNQNDYSPSGISGALVLRLTSSTTVNITGLDHTGSFAGRQVTIENIGSNNITLTSNDSNSLAANRFLLPAPVVLRPSQNIQFAYDTTSGGWRCTNPVSAPPIVSGFKNLLVQNNGVSPTIKMDVTADAVILGDVNGNSYRALNVSISGIDITASGANGLAVGDTKTNNTWYSIWVIFNPTTNTIAGLFSSATTAPTSLPSGYTFYARVGWNRINASGNFTTIAQKNVQAQYTTAGATLASSGTVVVTTAIPPTAYGCNLIVGWGNAAPFTVTVDGIQVASFQAGAGAASGNFTGSAVYWVYPSGGTVVTVQTSSLIVKGWEDVF